MPEPSPGLIDALNTAVGGAATALAAAMIGRGMYHAQEVRARRRPILSWDLIWEVPLAVGMALIGEGLAEYWGLSRSVGTALIAVISYLGPRGVGALFEKWIAGKKG